MAEIEGTRMKRTLLLLLLAVVALSLLVAWRILVLRELDRHILAHARTGARAMMSHLAVRADMIALEANDVATTDLVGALLLKNDLALMERLNADAESGHILDRWGNPIWLRPSAEGEASMVFVSFGPDGVDESGKGDDLVIPAVMRSRGDAEEERQ